MLMKELILKKEQLPLIIRFTDASGLIHEEFMEFVHCDTGITSRAIADKIKSSLKKLSLDLNYLRGQGYDGAGNMSGKYQGAAAII